MYKTYKLKATPKLVAVIIGAALFVLILLMFYPSSHKNEVSKTIHSFYTYEREANFSESWDLLHSHMKDKFIKLPYIQDRAHVFMGHFGVETFTYSFTKPRKIKNWEMTSTTVPIPTVYQSTVTQVYKGKYGRFSWVQDIYVTRENKEWKILWDYKK